MKDLSVSQSYMLCTLSESGKLPALNSENQVCLLAGALIDLLFERSVGIGEKKKLFISGELGGETQYLKSLYDFIKEAKPMKVEQLASEYAFTFSDKRIMTLISDIGASLAGLGCVRMESRGLLSKTARFLPDRKYVDYVIQSIRAELLEDGPVSDNMIALASLLDKSNQIKEYFSKYEKDQLKSRLKEIRNSESHKMAKEMIDYVDVLVVVIATTSIH